VSDFKLIAKMLSGALLYWLFKQYIAFAVWCDKMDHIYDKR